MGSLLQPPENLSRHPVDVGERSEAIIFAELVKRGHQVLIPHGTNHRYDIVIDVGGRFLRAQCKTGRLRRGVIEFATGAPEQTRGACSIGRTTPTRLISSSSTVLIPTASMLSASMRSGRSADFCVWIPQLTVRLRGFAGPPTMNCPPSSIGRALHL